MSVNLSHGIDNSTAVNEEVVSNARPISTTAEEFVYPPLDLTKSQFRVLQLLPGHHDDKITCYLQTFDLPALPLSYQDEKHLTQLNEVYESLSTAVGEWSAMQFAELERWERLYEELRELYEHRALAEVADKLEIEAGARIPTAVEPGPEWTKLRNMTASFISRAKEYHEVSTSPFPTDEFLALIGRLESPVFMARDVALNRDYQAVSYCCGDQEIKQEIDLNNIGVQVPVTAANALRGLRLEDHVRDLWIDAICIDQGNANERAHQVLRLARIYSSATHTLVWLGDEDEPATQTLSSCLQDLEQSVHLLPMLSGLVMSYGGHTFCAAIPPKFKDEQPPCMRNEPSCHHCKSKALVAVLSKYLHRPWFSRLWMYQEVLLSQQCLCCIGSYEIEWSYVWTAFSMRRLPKATQAHRLVVGELGWASPWMRTASVRPGFSVGKDQLSLRELLIETIPLDCSNERDKVYAVLGLTQWSRKRKSVPLEIWPDYKKTAAACMRDATVAVLREDADLNCLSLRTLTGSRPTWVVPWHRLRNDFCPTSYIRLRTSKKDLDCSNGRLLDCDSLIYSTAADSLFPRGYRFRRVGKTSSVTALEQIEKLSVQSKLRMVMEMIDDATGGEVADVDPRIILGTVCWDLGSFSHVEYHHPACTISVGPVKDDQGIHIELDTLLSSPLPPDDQEGREKFKEDRHSILLEDNGKCSQSFLGASQQRRGAGLTEQRDEVLGEGKDKPAIPSKARAGDGDGQRSATADLDVFGMITDLQANWNRGHSLHTPRSEPPYTEDSEDSIAFFIHSRLNDCLTKSRFYIPLPDWTMTEPTRASVGIGPKEMESGDQVAILFGCRQPVILRPQQSSWLYVGSAYAHEMMDGSFVRIREYMQGIEPGLWESEIFEIQ